MGGNVFTGIFGSIGDGFWSLNNILLVNSNKDEIVGERYKTINAAKVYAKTQSPSATSKWGILYGGNNSEAVSVASWIAVIGMNSTSRLTGALTSEGAAAGDPSEYMVSNCTVTNLVLGAGQMIMFMECIIDSPTTPAAGYFIGIHSRIFQIDLTNVVTYLYYTSSFYLGYGVRTFGSAIVNFGVLEGATILGGVGAVYKGVIFSSEIYPLSGSPAYFTNCDVSVNMTIPNGIWVFMTGGSAKDIVIDVGGHLVTDGTALGTVTGDLTGWTNKGDAYNDSASGLTATDEQAAIDKIALNHILGTQIFS